MKKIQGVTTNRNGGRKLRTLLLLFASVICFDLFGQQEWGYSQYLFNLFDINGAYAGNHESVSTALRYRKQWVGFSGAPETQSFSLHTPIAGESSAAGLRIKHETIGARTTFHARVTGVYKLRLGPGKISFGISAGLLHQQFNINDLNIRDANDPYLGQDQWSSNTPTIDVALLYHDDRMYVGIESTGINRQKFGWMESSIARLYAQTMLVGGWMKKVGGDDLIHLSALAKVSEGQIYQAEANASFLWNNRIWIGGGYRLSYGIVVFSEWNITDQWRLGYSFDLAMNKLATYQDGSHELFLGFNFGAKPHSSIRYF
jgi:type IX secretion system PorP/SprF family membrane protein